MGMATLGADRDRLIRSFEEDVAVHADSELVPSGDLDRRLHVQVTPGDLCAGLAQFLADRASGGLSGRWVCQSALAASLGDLERGGEHARQYRESNKPTIVVVYLV